MSFDYLQNLRQQQSESIKARQEELDKAQEEQERYLQSEQYQKDIWEAGQDAWERKAQKEGRTYVRKPFVSAADRQRAEKKAKEEEIAFLKERLANLQATD